MPRLLIEEPQSVASMPRTNPAAYGAGVGQAMDTTGRLTQAFSQVVAEWSESESRSAAVRYEQDLKAGAQEIAADPDIEGRMGKFEALEQRLRSSYSPKLGSGRVYDDQTNLASNDIRTALMGKTAGDALKMAEVNLDQQLEVKTDFAAEMDDLGARMAHQLEGEEAIANAAARGVIPPWKVDGKLREFRTGIRDSLVMRKINANPAEAIRFLDSEFEGTVEEREAFKEKALREGRLRAQNERAAANARRREEREAAKATSEAAQEDLIRLWGEDKLTAADVLARSGDLDNKSEMAMMRIAKGPKAKGRGRGSRPSRLSLYEAGIDGDDVAETATQALSQGGVGPEDRAAAISASRQPQYAPARRHLVDFVKQADAMGPANADKAIDQFEAWAAKNPEASAEDAEEKAHEIVLKHAKRTPKGTSLIYEVFGEGGMTDIDASIDLLDQSLERGSIDEGTYRAEQVKLLKIKKWQDYRAGLEAAQ